MTFELVAAVELGFVSVLELVFYAEADGVLEATFEAGVLVGF